MSLGGGQIVPYPEPGSPSATKIGKANRRVGSKPEEALRRDLHGLGLRYRKDRLVRAGDVRTHPDIVFGPVLLAVFVDGCFWHACPEHFHMPKSNLEYWRPKLARNVERDARIEAALRMAGWSVLRIWEHVPAREAAGVVVDELVRLGYPSGQRAANRLYERGAEQV